MAEQNENKQSHARGHAHGTRCYWDYRECRWVCRPAPEGELSSQPQPVAAAAPSS
jgi:hypothetical protein